MPFQLVTRMADSDAWEAVFSVLQALMLDNVDANLDMAENLLNLAGGMIEEEEGEEVLVRGHWVRFNPSEAKWTHTKWMGSPCFEKADMARLLTTREVPVDLSAHVARSGLDWKASV